jgi:hypothetical protein
VPGSGALATPTGDVLVPSEDGSIYAFDAHGALLWKTKTTSAIDSSPAFGRDHTIYFGAFDRALHAVDSGGHEKWTFKTGGPVNSSPAVADDGTVFFGSEDKKLYAVAPDGTLVWSFATEGPIDSSPAIGPTDTSGHRRICPGTPWRSATSRSPSPSTLARRLQSGRHAAFDRHHAPRPLTRVACLCRRVLPTTGTPRWNG